jgi:aminoglycoside 3-N-acetyltransferase
VNPISLAAWAKIAQGFDAKLTYERIAATWKAIRWNSTDGFFRHAETITDWMRKDGLQDVEVLRLPSDGRTAHGGWVMPLAWSPRAARLAIVSPGQKDEVLADYQQCPHHLAMWSSSTPPAGITAELIHAKAKPTAAQLRAVRGRIVLLDGSPNLDHIIRLQRAGALGYVTDYVRIYPGIRTADEVDDAVSYLNYHQPQWQVPKGDRGFGFAITPATGRRLRALLANGPVHLHAKVDVDLGEGDMPVITGRIPGRTGQEILITGHIDEPGANDNASGPMLGLSVGRLLAQLVRQGWRPERGLRFFYSVEVRALNAMINTHPHLFKQAVWAVNLDMLGCDQREVRSTLEIAPNPPPLPDPILPLLLKTRPKARGFRWKLVNAVNDNPMGDPAVGIPTTVLEQAPDITYHTNLDTPEKLSIPAMQRMGTWVSSLLGHLCSAGPREVVALARLNVTHAKKTLSALAKTQPDSLTYHVAQERRRIDGLRRWLPEEPFPWAHTQKTTKTAPQRQGLSGSQVALGDLTKLSHDLTSLAPKRKASANTRTDRFSRQASLLVPQKTYKGFFAAESLQADQRKRLERAAEESFGWGAPTWLDWALFWSSGKQTLADISRSLNHERRNISCERLIRVFRCLEEFGFVRFRLHLTSKDFRKALRAVGVKPGMLLMVHSSLSAFGYVEGGSATCIDALSATLGTRGTLAMPTHSLSVLGKPVYQAATSPSLVGAVTESFRKMPGVIRSPHPTHSVAASGPLATTLTAGHTAAMAPLAKDGFWGRFVENDGWVLMMSPPSTNTLMHAAEVWSGIPLPGIAVPVRQGKQIRTTTVPNGNWHIEWFRHLYDRLKRRGLLHSVKLGEHEIHLMRGRDIIENGLKLLAKDPLMITKSGCECPFCDFVRLNIAALRH